MKDAIRHRPQEDALAVLTGTSLMALGVILQSKAGLLTGGTSGLALLLHYATGWGFPVLFFCLNIPFYALSAMRLGWKLTLRTFVAVALVSLFARWTPVWIEVSRIEPLYAAVGGGVMMGVGLLILFRHRTSLGGVNIVALYAQERHGLNAGWVQLCIDAAILASALFVVPVERVAVSLVGVAALNLVLATNHRPGRYTGVS